MKMIEKLKEIYKDEDYFDPYLLESEIENWPEIPEPSDDDDDTDNDDVDVIYIKNEEQFFEPIDVENFMVTELGDDYLVIKCGGDWQDPYEVRIEISNDNLTVVSYELTYFEGDEIDMDEVLEFEN